MPYQCRLAQITDGTSNTLLMSEVIVARQDNNQGGAGVWQNGDFRGHIWHDATVSSPSHCPNIFMTINGPNSTRAGQRAVRNDPQYRPDNAVREFGDNDAAERGPQPASGRRQCFDGDGSVRFAANNINLTAWQALGTMDGGETTTE